MDPDIQSVTPKVEDDTHITGLMADHHPHDAVSKVPSDGKHMPLSNTSMQPATPPVPQLETISESVIPYPTLSDSLPESPQNALASNACHPVIVSDVHSGAQQAYASLSQDSAECSVSPMDSGSDDNTHGKKSTHESGCPSVDLGVPSVAVPCPSLVPLPESDVEEDQSSESSRDEEAASNASSSSQNSDDTASTDGRTSPLSDPDPQIPVQPSKQSPLETPSYVHL